MKDYPIDKTFPLICWPMEIACRVKSKVGKALLILLYFPWFVLCLPILAPVLFVSIAMAVWDDVNE